MQGLVNLNRAIQDDIVAVEILPESQWAAPSSLVLEEKDEELAEEEQEKDVYLYLQQYLTRVYCSNHVCDLIFGF